MSASKNHVKVPDNDTHVMYVWIDALCNYITALQYAFGVQNIVYSCKLDFQGKPYLEFYIFSADSKRNNPYIFEYLFFYFF